MLSFTKKSNLIERIFLTTLNTSLSSTISSNLEPSFEIGPKSLTPNHLCGERGQGLKQIGYKTYKREKSCEKKCASSPSWQRSSPSLLVLPVAAVVSVAKKRGGRHEYLPPCSSSSPSNFLSSLQSGGRRRRRSGAGDWGSHKSPSHVAHCTILFSFLLLLSSARPTSDNVIHTHIV